MQTKFGEIHFVTDLDKVQSGNKKFGPIDASKFQVTSSFLLTGKANVYAAVKGKLIILDQISSTGVSDPDHVNAILIPTQKLKTEFTPKIQFIIYRGLKRNSFMNQVGSEWKILPEQDCTTEFMINLYKNVKEKPDVTLENLGYIDYDNVIHNISYFEEHAKNVQVVEIGTQIGECDVELGIDFVLREFRYAFPANFMFSSELVIDLNYDPVSNGKLPGAEPPKILLKRELIQAFLDPTVGYNLFRGHSVSYHENANIKTVSGFQVYNIILKKAFQNKNRIYIDIRNNYDFSLNFYNDNEDENSNTGDKYNLLMAINGSSNSSFEEIPCYFSYWPIIILENIATADPKNYINIKINFLKKYNPNPSFYFDFCFPRETITFANKNESVIEKYNSLNTIDRLVDLPPINNTGPDVEFFVPASTIDKEGVAWIVKLYCLRNFIEPMANVPRLPIHSSSYDNIFGPIEEHRLGVLSFDSLNLPANTKSFIGISKKYIPAGSWNSIPRMVETGVTISDTEIIFSAQDLALNQPSKTFYEGIKAQNSHSQTVSGQSFLDNPKQSFETNTDKKYFKVPLIANDHTAVYSNPIFIFENYYKLHLTKDQILFAQDIIKNNFDTSLHPVSFGFDVNNEQIDDKGRYFGKARLNLYGYDQNGQFLSFNNLGENFTNLYIATIDGKTLTTFDASQMGDIDENYEKSIYTVDEYLKLVREVESKYPHEEPYTDIETQKKYISEILYRIRTHYYGKYDSSSSLKEAPLKYFNRDKFEMAIPDARRIEDFEIKDERGVSYPPDRLTPLQKLSTDTFKQIVRHADENSVNDNPSPYIFDPDGILIIDIGHLLLELDGLINNYNNTGEFYNNFQIYRSNDFTGYIADMFIAAAEERVYKNGEVLVDFLSNFHYPNPDSPNRLERLYEISAPNADLLSDIDPFGIFNAYHYFVIEANSMPSGKEKTLSSLLEFYYDKNVDLTIFNNVPSLKNIPPHYSKRWLNFCREYPCGRGSNAIFGTVDERITMYQGFVEFDMILNKFKWVADLSDIPQDISMNPHISITNLKIRGEVFAHFWYQSSVSKISTVLTGFTGQSSFLKKGTPQKPVRFERPFINSGLADNQTIKGEISDFIGLDSDPAEIEYVMLKFLTWVKTNFEAENP